MLSEILLKNLPHDVLSFLLQMMHARLPHGYHFGAASVECEFNISFEHVLDLFDVKKSLSHVVSIIRASEWTERLHAQVLLACCNLGCGPVALIRIELTIALPNLECVIQEPEAVTLAIIADAVL